MKYSAKLLSAIGTKDTPFQEKTHQKKEMETVDFHPSFSEVKIQIDNVGALSILKRFKGATYVQLADCYSDNKAP